ncbi:LuxR C-terminal-related transcriptional regulator [Nocardia sp. NPDC057353]|uniref:helix-turn-helix transcriptional regulator n=1 Tax=Nocardia sp. NPDC057353 TaxID=3346104 RepID=UPI0036419887
MTLSSRIGTTESRTIARPALVAQVDAAVRPGAARVLVVSAPAGSGRTSLLSAWAEQSRYATGTLTVTAERADAESFPAALAAELGLPQPATGHRTPVSALTELLARRPADAPHTVLILDDVHLIADPLVLAGLEQFLRLAPPTLVTVLSGRADPPLRWHTMPDQRLRRIGADRLAFTDAEAALVCAAQGCPLEPAELDAVMRLTRGWPALVRIAALYLDAYPGDRSAALAVLARPAAAVSDFLIGELLDALPARLRDFLVLTSVPEEFTEPLAALLAGPETGELLYRLERLGFPITRTGTEGTLWYRYHPLLRAYLLAEVNRLGRERAARLHLVTANWLQAAGLGPAALPHLLAQPDDEPIRGYLRTSGPAMVLAEAGPALLTALTRERPLLADDPFVWALRAVDALVRGENENAVAFLDVLATRDGTASFAPAGWVAALAAAAGLEAALLTAGAPTPAAEPPSTAHPDIDAYAAVQWATRAVLDGGRERGEELLRRALTLAESAGQPRLVVRAATRLAMAAGLADDLGGMRRRAGHALDFAARHDISEVVDVAQARAMLVFAGYLRGEEQDAAALDGVLESRPDAAGAADPVAGRHALVTGLLVRCAQADDRYAAVAELREQLLALLDRHPRPRVVGGLVRHAAWELLAVHEPVAARGLLDRARERLGELPDLVVGAAALAHAGGRPKAVRSLLAPLAGAELPVVTAVTAQLLLAAAHRATGAPAGARECLATAVRLAEPEHLIRPFLEVPGAIRMLDEAAGCFGHRDTFVAALRRHPAAGRGRAAHGLTETEMQVLARLPSGRTAGEIAVDLGISVNTVKTHLRGIYTKLQAHSRTAALDRARSLGLL